MYERLLIWLFTLNFFRILQRKRPLSKHECRWINDIKYWYIREVGHYVQNILIWLLIGFSGELLWAEKGAMLLQKGPRISWPAAEWAVTSKPRHRSIELANITTFKAKIWATAQCKQWQAIITVINLLILVRRRASCPAEQAMASVKLPCSVEFILFNKI